jgi:amino acid adenylation domain-containing protein
MIREEYAINFNFFDVSADPLKHQRVQTLIEESIYRTYEVLGGELVYYVLIKFDEMEYVSVLATHHILMDGIGFASHLLATCSQYEAIAQQQIGVLPADHFPDYLSVVNSLYDTPETLEFWEAVLHQVEPLVFKSGLPVIPDAPCQVSTQTVTLSDAHWQAIASYTRGKRVTPAIYLKVLYGILIHLYCRPTADFIVADLQAGRPKGHGEVMGCYFQQIPFVFPLQFMAANTKIDALLSWCRDFQRSLKSFKNISIAEQSRILGSSGVHFMYNYIHFFPTLEIMGKQETIEQYMNDVPGQVQFVPKLIDGKMHLNLYHYDTDFMAPNFLDRMVSISEQIIAGGVCLQDLDWVLDSEKQRLFSWNATHKIYPSVPLVQNLFEQQVQMTPNQVAVIDETDQLSYRELDARSNQLAHFLRENKIGKGDRVALYLDRSIWMVVAIMGVAKAGAIYVPIDPDFPQQRMRFILEDSHSRLLLTQTSLLSKIELEKMDLFLCLDRQAALLEQYPKYAPALESTHEDVFNLLYTSGSTGQPKGVMVRHAGIVNRLQWMQDAYQMGSQDRVLQKTPYTFDVSVWEFFWPLMTGATLVMARPEGHKNPAYLVDTIKRFEITTLHFVPSMLTPFLQEENVGSCRTLKRVVCSGEALTPEHQSLFFAQLPECQLHNLYGPTEASIDVTAWQCKPELNGESIPIGKPIANTQVYILDQQKRLLPPGIPGELYLSGVCLAEGYLNQPQLTSAAFLANPFHALPPYDRLYRTGDEVVWSHDGNVYYIGRMDFQVKIRGLRIELGEIETRLREIKGVREAVVLVAQDGREDKRLIAYFQCQSGVMLQASVVRNHLKNALPDYMIPSQFIQLDQLPLTHSGKLDRKKLSTIKADAVMAEATASPPQTETEHRLASLWAELLGCQRVGRNDHFFHCGGHSLMMIRLAGRIREEFRITPPLEVLFDLPVLSDMALYIQTARKVTGGENKRSGSDRVEVEI